MSGGTVESTGIRVNYSPSMEFLEHTPPCPTSCSGNGSIWQAVSFGRDVLSFSRAADEVMYFLSGEIKRHIPQPDRKRGLEWFPEKLLYVACKISNFYFDSRSISLQKLITALLQSKFHYIHKSVHIHAYLYHGLGLCLDPKGKVRWSYFIIVQKDLKTAYQPPSVFQTLNFLQLMMFILPGNGC